MKILLLIVPLLAGQALSAQIVASKKDVEEYNFFYSDTANGEFVYGSYEPKDLIKLSDGSILIGTELSVFFPSEYSSPHTYDSIYFARHKIFQEKSHIGSGTVFKLNTSFEKEWEIIFKGQRIEHILKTSDERIVVVGEAVSLDFVWLAEIDKNGKVLWEKQYKYKKGVSLADAAIDANNEIYLLLEGSRILPVQTVRYFDKRKRLFFREEEINSCLAILKTSSKGKKRWLKPIDTKKDYNKYGYALVSYQESIFASYISSGFEKHMLIEDERVVQFSASGKRISCENIPQQDMLFYKDGLVTITSYSKGNLSLYKSGNPIDSIHIESADSDVRVEKAINSSDNYLVLGSNYDNNRDYLLINLNSNLKFTGYWTYPRDEFNEIRGAVVLESGEIMVVGKCYREIENEPLKLITYINLVKVKSGN